MESTTFYAAVCLYNLQPDSDESRVRDKKLFNRLFSDEVKLEAALFHQKEKTGVCEGQIEEVWTKRPVDNTIKPME